MKLYGFSHIDLFGNHEKPFFMLLISDAGDITAFKHHSCPADLDLAEITIPEGMSYDAVIFQILSSEDDNVTDPLNL